MKKKLFLTIVSLFLLPLLLAEASTVQRESLDLDESLTGEVETSFQSPNKIYIAQIEKPKGLFSNTNEWIQLLHYYLATRLELADVPFHYVVDEFGGKYKILDSSKAPYANIDAGTLVIAYVSESTEISNNARSAFRDLVESYSYDFGIEVEQIEPVKLSFEEGVPEYEEADGVFNASVLRMIRDFEYSEEANIRFAGTIQDLEYDGKVPLGENLKVNFTLKNTDSFPWHIGEDFVFLSTADGEESIFAINQVWDSFSKPFALSDQAIPSGEGVELSFELQTEGILPDTYSEDFKFVMLPDIDVEGTEFTVSFEIDKGDAKIVEIARTNTGALTVYSCPEHTCEMVAGAISGERYVVIDEEESWYKIIVDGVEGWVTMHYANLID